MSTLQETIRARRKELGLTDPLPVQYLKFMEGVLHGDFGRSFKTHEQIKTPLSF